MTQNDFRGQISLLNVWASWCPACRDEHPILVDLARQYKIPIYGLDYKDDRIEAKKWLEAYGNPFHAIGFDKTGRVAIDWGIYGAPETFLIDKNGIVIHKHIAPLTREIWQRDFVPLIAVAEGER